MSAAGEKAERLVHLSLDDPALAARNADLEHERRVAIFDILENNHFALVDGPAGPYRLKLSLADRGIVFAVSDKEGGALSRIELSMRPLRRNIRDYFLICESYFEAMRNATPERVETIDQARRALHNESAELLKTSLADKVLDAARLLDWEGFLGRPSFAELAAGVRPR